MAAAAIVSFTGLRAGRQETEAGAADPAGAAGPSEDASALGRERVRRPDSPVS